MHSARSSLLAVAALLTLSVATGAQSATQAGSATPPPAGPEVGQAAPDFTAQWADGSGPRATPVTLSALRGKVVVLAFYPKDRSAGCTAELTKFRDEHAKLFGADVVLLPVSVDSLASHASWASEMKFPFALVSDPALEVAGLYGSRAAGRPVANRTVYVIAKDGTVAWREMKFNALNEEAYATLAAAVAKAR